MTEEKHVLLELRGIVAGMAPADQALVVAAAESIRAIMAAYPAGHGILAVGIIGAELAEQAT